MYFPRPASSWKFPSKFTAFLFRPIDYARPCIAEPYIRNNSSAGHVTSHVIGRHSNTITDVASQKTSNVNVKWKPKNPPEQGRTKIHHQGSRCKLHSQRASQLSVHLTPMWIKCCSPKSSLNTLSVFHNDKARFLLRDWWSPEYQQLQPYFQQYHSGTLNNQTKPGPWALISMPAPGGVTGVVSNTIVPALLRYLWSTFTLVLTLSFDINIF